MRITDSNSTHAKLIADCWKPNFRFKTHHLQHLHTLSSNDFLADEEWRFAPVIVTNNTERRNINARQTIRFASIHQKPIIQWRLEIVSTREGTQQLAQALSLHLYANESDETISSRQYMKLYGR
jgi:hypothetical protein